MKQRYRIRFRGALLTNDKKEIVAVTGEYRSSKEAIAAAKAIKKLNKPEALLRVQKSRTFVGYW